MLILHVHFITLKRMITYNHMHKMKCNTYFNFITTFMLSFVVWCKISILLYCRKGLPYRVLTLNVLPVIN